MERHVGIGGRRRQVLPDHEDRLSVRYRAGANKAHIGGDANVAGDPFPSEVKRVFSPPDVCAAPGHTVFAAGTVEFNRSCLRSNAEILMRFKNADRRAGPLLRQSRAHQQDGCGPRFQKKMS